MRGAKRKAAVDKVCKYVPFAFERYLGSRITAG